MKQHRNGFFIGGSKPPDGYGIWSEMRNRCHNMQSWAWRWYGARGIKVCDRWDDPAAFISDMGPRPTKLHTLDRIDTNGNYEPGNCKWSTMADQVKNRRNSILIDGLTIQEIADALGINYSSVYGRFQRGWSVEQILNTEKITDGSRSTNRLITANGKTQSMSLWAKETGLSVSAIHSRLKSGRTDEEAVFAGSLKAKGEKAYQAKLTEAAVLEIRASSEKGTVLAKKYGVSSTLIYMVRKNKIW